MSTLILGREKEMTASEYEMLSESNLPCQLVNGLLFMSPAPTPNHQRIVRRLFKLIDGHIKDNGEVLFSPIDLYVDEKNVYQPDLIYLSSANKSAVTKRGVEKSPDLIIEVISPSNSHVDRYTKKEAYARIRVKEYWIIDPGNETIEIFSSANQMEQPVFFLAEAGTVYSPLLPSLAFELSEIWNS